MSPGILSRVMKSFVLSTSLDRLSIGQSSNVCSQFPKHPRSSENGSLEGDDTGDRENLPTRLPGWICWKTVTGHSFSAIDREVEPLNSVTFQQRSFCRAQIGEQAGWETTGMKKTWRRDGDTDPPSSKATNSVWFQSNTVRRWFLAAPDIDMFIVDRFAFRWLNYSLLRGISFRVWLHHA